MSSGKLVVGIAGLKYHGKDTAASVLIEKYGFERVSFADGVKEVVATILHVPVEDLHNPDKKETLHVPSGKTYRQWMQLIGTEVGRAIWEPVWINWWRDEIKAKNIKRVVATDLRFPNELKAIREMHGSAFRIVRPSLLNANVDVHESERYAMSMEVDEELINDSTPAMLAAKFEIAALGRMNGAV